MFSATIKFLKSRDKKKRASTNYKTGSPRDGKRPQSTTSCLVCKLSDIQLPHITSNLWFTRGSAATSAPAAALTPSFQWPATTTKFPSVMHRIQLFPFYQKNDHGNPHPNFDQHKIDEFLRCKLISLTPVLSR